VESRRRVRPFSGPWRLWAALACLGSSGCVFGARGGARAAGPIVLEPLQVAPVRVSFERNVLRPPLEVHIDEILSSPVLRDPDFEAAVASWIDYWRGPASPWFGDFLGRMASFEPMVDTAIANEDLPPSLRYLPFIESGYNPRASSSAHAIGMWQFMEDTAEGLGLRVTPLLDQRRDPEISTAAAISFLAKLRQDFGSWFLALAAYNSGPNRVRRVLARYAPGATPSDSLFWSLRRRFPTETRDFVPKLIGAIVVARDQMSRDADPPAADPFRFDRVSVPDATTLDVVARAAAVPQQEIEDLNPEYVRGMTPPGRRSELRVPEGTGAAFTAAYALIPPEERVTFVEHRVVAGETLSHIARRYGVRVADIEAANPKVRPRYLKVGALLTVPVAPSVRQRLADR
jgi:peptidoglycan lytic transglycosylase D